MNGDKYCLQWKKRKSPETESVAMPIVSPSVCMTLDDKYSKLSNGAWRLTAIAEVIMVAPIQTIRKSSSEN